MNQNKLKDIVKAALDFDSEERERGNSPPLVLQEVLVEKTRELCRKLGADENLALISAYLMDIKIGQAIREGRVKDHIEMSFKAAEEFLKKFNLPKDILNKIENIIKSHHGNIPYGCLEAEIVANADCFKFLHPKAATFFLTDLGKRDYTFPEALDYFEKKIEEKHKIISLDICKKEAEEYYKLLHKLVDLAKG